MTAVYVGDGFIDRYSGDRLVFPAVLRIISGELPDVLPFHRNWKMSETHLAYWDLLPMIDHPIPGARGGRDDRSNWVTTSMARNAAKGASTLDQLGWTLHPKGDLAEWDGMGRWLIEYLQRFPERAADNYVRTWTNALRSEFNEP